MGNTGITKKTPEWNEYVDAITANPEKQETTTVSPPAPKRSVDDIDSLRNGSQQDRPDSSRYLSPNVVPAKADRETAPVSELAGLLANSSASQAPKEPQAATQATQTNIPEPIPEFACGEPGCNGMFFTKTGLSKHKKRTHFLREPIGPAIENQGRVHRRL